MVSLLAVATGIFLLTHLDTLLVLLVFGTSPGYRPVEIFIGHALGTMFGLTVTILGVVLATELLHDYAFLLGLIPLGLGFRGLDKRRESGHPRRIAEDLSGRRRISNVTLAGVGLSGENIAIFIPLFAGLSMVELAALSTLYLIGAGLIFVVAILVGRRTTELALPKWIEAVLVPVSLIVVGLYVFGSGWLAA